MARNTRNDVAWEYVSSGGEDGMLGKRGSWSLASDNLEILLGLKGPAGFDRDEAGVDSWVAYRGEMMSLEGRVVAVRSEGSSQVDLF